MRVVTGGAADASLVLVVVALAVEDAVGLEADVLDAADAHHLHLNPRAVARAAELRQAFGVEPAGVQNMPPGRPRARARALIAATCLSPGP